MNEERPKKFVKIGNREIGPDQPPYIVAELSANHNGDLARARQLLKLAKDNGADAVKLQTYTADTMTLDLETPDFLIRGGLWDGYSLYRLYQEAHTPWEWHRPLFDYAKELGLTIFSTPFDKTSADFLEELGAPAYKIASFELTDIPLVRHVARKGKPLILSTGLATAEEIGETIAAIHAEGNRQLIVLHCVSGYPTPEGEMNLRTLRDIAERFQVVAGLSDHSMGIHASVVSIALGACFIEKHFIDSRSNKGPDSSFSIEPAELKELSEQTKRAWRTIGKVNYQLKASEKDNLKYRRSLYFVKDVEAGEVITEACVRSIRPGYGLAPKLVDQVIGKTAKRRIAFGEPVTLDVLK